MGVAEEIAPSKSHVILYLCFYGLYNSKCVTQFKRLIITIKIILIIVCKADCK